MSVWMCVCVCVRVFPTPNARSDNPGGGVDADEHHLLLSNDISYMYLCACVCVRARVHGGRGWGRFCVRVCVHTPSDTKVKWLTAYGWHASQHDQSMQDSRMIG